MMLRNKNKEEIKKLKEEIKNLERKIKIKDNWCRFIWQVGFDYDGCNTIKSLKGLVDELISYAEKALESDDKSVVYTSITTKGEETKENILFERINENEL